MLKLYFLVHVSEEEKVSGRSMIIFGTLEYNVVHESE